MNAAQVGAIVRALVQAASGYFVAQGMIDQDTAVAVTGAFVTLVTAGYSVYIKRR